MQKIKVLVLAVLMLIVTALPAGAADTIPVFVNNQEVTFLDQKPYLQDNRTMVPVRAVMEQMGCKVDWDATARQAIITKGDTTAVFTIGSFEYTVNNVTKQMDTVAVITSNRTAFPIRFCAEAFGAEVKWDEKARAVRIFTDNEAVNESNVIKRETTGIPNRDYGKDIINYKVKSFPFTTKVTKTEILGIEYRDGNLYLQIAENPVEMIKLLWDNNEIKGATLFINGNHESTYYPVSGGFESQFKVRATLDEVKRYYGTAILIPGDGLYYIPNPYWEPTMWDD